jgi:hypothetical protein
MLQETLGLLKEIFCPTQFDEWPWEVRGQRRFLVNGLYQGVSALGLCKFIFLSDLSHSKLRLLYFCLRSRLTSCLKMSVPFGPRRFSVGGG